MDRPRVLNKYKDKIPSDAVYIGRPSVWGNPFVIVKDGTREEVIAKHKAYFKANKSLQERALKELKGKSLVCFCAPNSCHGDILLRFANYKHI